MGIPEFHEKKLNIRKEDQRLKTVHDRFVNEHCWWNKE